MSIDDNTQRTLRSLVGSIEKQFGKGAIMAMGEENKDTDIRIIPTGSIALDHALGVNGYPRGRIVEIYGPESSGKTTLALHAMREGQRGGGIAAFIDAEHAFDMNYAKAIGVDHERLLLSQPDNGEQALDIVEMLTRSGAIDVIAINSVAALTPKAEIDGERGDAHVGVQSRLMSQALRKLTAVAHRTGTLLIFLNPLRQRTGIVFGNPETTTGANTLKFYASVRLDVRRVAPVKVGEESVGSRTRVRVVKNKCACPFREAELDIRWGTGIDMAGDLLDVGVELGIVEKNGTRLVFQGDVLGVGREQARKTVLLGTTAARLRQAIEDAERQKSASSGPRS